jgi:hypothetical protein
MITDTSRRGRSLLGLASLALVVLVGCGGPVSTADPVGASSAATTVTATPAPGGGPEITSVGFSTEGDRCTLGTAATSFAVGTPIHTLLEMEPALPTGGTVTVTVEKDGVEIVEARQTVSVTEPAPCIFSTMHDLEAGHYRISYAITPSAMPPATGEFDVTP